MTQYRLKKETFGIPAGTIPMKMNEEWYTIECGTLLYRIPAEAVENCDGFEKVEEPKKLAPAVIHYRSGVVSVRHDRLFESKTQAKKFWKSSEREEMGTVTKVIWPARFDDEGYLIMEVDG